MYFSRSLSRRSSTGSIPSFFANNSSPSSTGSSNASGFSPQLMDVLRKRGLLTRLMRPSRPRRTLHLSPLATSGSSAQPSPLSSNDTESLYTTPSPLASLEGVSNTAEPLIIGNSYRILDRVRKIGVENMITTSASQLPSLGECFFLLKKYVTCFSVYFKG